MQFLRFDYYIEDVHGLSPVNGCTQDGTFQYSHPIQGWAQTKSSGAIGLLKSIF